MARVVMFAESMVVSGNYKTTKTLGDYRSPPACPKNLSAIPVHFLIFLQYFDLYWKIRTNTKVLTFYSDQSLVNLEVPPLQVKQIQEILNYVFPIINMKVYNFSVNRTMLMFH